MKFARLLLLSLSVCFILTVSRTAEAKDEWIEVKSKNFFLIGNASEKDIRKVGVKLEQFRESFRMLFKGATLSSPIKTNVVVFKNDSSYRPFKPKRGDGKIDDFIAGYFQAGEDVNYITLSADGEDADMYGTIFHEYVHFILETNIGKSEIPTWFNEGLAEYYQTFRITGDQKVDLGLPQSNHLQLLQQTKLMPLDQLFKVSNRQLHQTGNHSRSIFYAQSWALTHYFLQSGKSEAMGVFIASLQRGVEPEKAFNDAFKTTYQIVEKELRKYVEQSSYKYVSITFGEKLEFDSQMQVAPITDAASNAYLGDLLYRIDRADDAEPYLLESLKLNPTLSMANLTLGMVRIKQRKWAEAKGHLEKAIAEDNKSHMAYYRYAYLLSRESHDEFGYVRAFPKETAGKMRDALKKAIAINPEFTESYELYAFVSLVNEEDLAESVTMLEKALKFQPGNQRYALRIAELQSRQEKYAEARATADKIARTTDDEEVRSRAENLSSQIKQRMEYAERIADQKKRYEQMSEKGDGKVPVLIRRTGSAPPTAEEIARISEELTIRSINEILRKPEAGETRVLGSIQKIECKGSTITYVVKTKDGVVNLTSKDFSVIAVNSFASEASNFEIGCGVDLSTLNAAITYRARTGPKGPFVGDLTTLELLPKNFRLLTEQELAVPLSAVGSSVSAGTDHAPATMTSAGESALPPPPVSTQETYDPEAMRREAMMNHIRGSLREPKPGEKRVMGFLDKIECTNKGVFVHIRSGSQTMRLLNRTPESLEIRLYTRDLEGVRFGCGIKPIEIPAVILLLDKPDPKAKTMGEVLALEFVPKSFTL